MLARIAAVLAVLPLSAIGPPKEPAPNFRATSLDGDKFSNESVKGRVVLIQFWTTWCRYCRADQPDVDDIVSEFAGKGLVVLAVSVNESKRTVTRYLSGSPRACKVVLTENTNLAAAFAARSFPLYVLIDADGKIAGKQSGRIGTDGLRRLLGKAGLN